MMSVVRFRTQHPEAKEFAVSGNDPLRNFSACIPGCHSALFFCVGVSWSPSARCECVTKNQAFFFSFSFLPLVVWHHCVRSVLFERGARARARTLTHTRTHARTHTLVCTPPSPNSHTHAHTQAFAQETKLTWVSHNLLIHFSLTDSTNRKLGSLYCSRRSVCRWGNHWSVRMR